MKHFYPLETFNLCTNNALVIPAAEKAFFWWCAGANIGQCRSEWNKFTAIGVFVLLVGLLATVSGTFFLTESLGVPLYFAVFGRVVGRFDSER